jgi:hypothetical protein
MLVYDLPELALVPGLEQKEFPAASTQTSLANIFADQSTPSVRGVCHDELHSDEPGAVESSTSGIV